MWNKVGHHVMGFDFPTDNPFVQLTFEGCQRLRQSETTKKEPITSQMIKSFVNKFGGKNTSLPDLRFLLTCLLGFSGFLRIEELLSIKIKHLRINESHLEILVPKSKTDQHREGHIVYICLHFSNFIRMLPSKILRKIFTKNKH